MAAMRTGITTGACAAAAAKAAAMVLNGQAAPQQVTIPLPNGDTLQVAVLYARLVARASRPRIVGASCPGTDAKQIAGETPATHECETPSPRAVAAVRKDAGDDPDVTHGLEIVVTLGPATGDETVFQGGEGVGTVTKPGLQIPPGQPAINPGPRRMISAAIAEVTAQPMCVEVAIPRGREIAAQTYNPRLGIVGGLSVLGTTGIVRPYCKRALLDSLKCALDVAAACGVRHLVLTPGNIGTRGVRRVLTLADEQVIEVGNEWDFITRALADYPFQAVLVAGHPGKLAKLAAGDWDTHSSRSASAATFVQSLAAAVGCPAPQCDTTEGIFDALAPDQRHRLAGELARLVRQAVWDRIGRCAPVAVLLVNMAGDELGRDGEFSPWQ